MGKLLAIMRGARAERTCDKSDISDKSGDFGRLSRFSRNSPAPESRPCGRALAAVPARRSASEGVLHILNVLDSRCPGHIEPDRWRQAVEDGRRFWATWGAKAHAFGWTAHDLFSLHKPPDKPHPNYRRLSRYDETGLIWLLKGREVIALTKDTVAIRCLSGSVTTYHKNNKPAFGPMGDSLDDLI
jgi:hypothetical protein